MVRNGDIEIEVALAGSLTEELRDWASIWADLMLVESILNSRSEMVATPPNIFVRRGLWEAALISYGRTVNSGQRRGMQDLASDFSPEEERVHRTVLKWRNHHVAHRIDPRRETVIVRGLAQVGALQLDGVRAHVNPAFGPEEEDPELEKAFQALVYRVRSEIWEKYMHPLKNQLISEGSEQQADFGTKAPSLPTDRGVWLSLDI